MIDSEALAWDAWRAVLAPFDIEVTEHDIAMVTGRAFADGYAHFAPRGLPPAETVEAQLTRATVDLFENHLDAFDDAYDTVEAAHERGVRIGVASSSSRQRLDASLRAAGLEGLLTVSAAGDEVTRGKPAPDVYLLAAHRMSVAPGDCVAVEDTQVGIDAARSAGMLVVAVRRGGEDLTADVVVPRLTPASVLHEV